MRRSGYSLFAFGFGSDHDSAQMHEIANAAEGVFTFVEEDSMVVDAFGGALGAQQGIVGQNLRLWIRSNVPVLQIYAGRYVIRPLSANNRSVEVLFSNIFSGEQRDVLLKLCVPSCPIEAERYALVTATVHYQTTTGETRQGVAATSCAAGLPAEFPVKMIMRHQGHATDATQMTFKIRWEGYGPVSERVSYCVNE